MEAELGERLDAVETMQALESLVRFTADLSTTVHERLETDLRAGDRETLVEAVTVLAQMEQKIRTMRYMTLTRLGDRPASSI